MKYLDCQATNVHDQMRSMDHNKALPFDLVTFEDHRSAYQIFLCKEDFGTF